MTVFSHPRIEGRRYALYATPGRLVWAVVLGALLAAFGLGLGRGIACSDALPSPPPGPRFEGPPTATPLDSPPTPVPEDTDQDDALAYLAMVDAGS